MARNDAALGLSTAFSPRNLLACLLLGLGTSAQAQYKFTKKVTQHILQQELMAANFNVSPELGIACSNDSCEIFWGPGGEAKDPRAIIDAHVYVDLRATARTERAQLRLLAAKWVAGTITPSEKDNLLKRLVLLLLGP